MVRIHRRKPLALEGQPELVQALWDGRQGWARGCQFRREVRTKTDDGGAGDWATSEPIALRSAMREADPMSSALDLPFDLYQAARLTPDEVRRELAVHLYRQGKLSFGKARELSGLSAKTFLHLLGSLGVDVNYDIGDYEADLATLRSLGRL